ncbi:hypothetical protein [Actinomadura sp. NTSP31]|uniref:hypothetical protein n=1 Tax=Actinomadura sp. NTSP31 TaxID=1735447 RepID=UPI0035C25903
MVVIDADGYLLFCGHAEAGSCADITLKLVEFEKVLQVIVISAGREESHGMTATSKCSKELRNRAVRLALLRCREDLTVGWVGASGRDPPECRAIPTGDQ